MNKNEKYPKCNENYFFSANKNIIVFEKSKKL